MDSLAERNSKARTNNLLSGALIAALLLGAVWMGFQEALPTNIPLPAFSWEKLDGTRVTPADLAGKVVMLDFWATWCKPCKAEMPILIGVAKAYESKGVVFVAANTDEAEDQKEAVEDFVRGMPNLKPYVALADSAEAGAKFKIEALPSLFIIDRSGKVLIGRAGMAGETELGVWLDEALKSRADSR